jgi:hypothetical protein
MKGLADLPIMHLPFECDKTTNVATCSIGMALPDKTQDPTSTLATATRMKQRRVRAGFGERGQEAKALWLRPSMAAWATTKRSVQAIRMSCFSLRLAYRAA